MNIAEAYPIIDSRWVLFVQPDGGFLQKRDADAR